ncbi:hypothetical protein K439DRAFT_722387 [Ramaria rubella]|nr:hypothetical protein K439DRAFT_722387 [Ramaria rubella]
MFSKSLPVSRQRILICRTRNDLSLLPRIGKKPKRTQRRLHRSFSPISFSYLVCYCCFTLYISHVPLFCLHLLCVFYSISILPFNLLLSPHLVMDGGMCDDLEVVSACPS